MQSCSHQAILIILALFFLSCEKDDNKVKITRFTDTRDGTEYKAAEIGDQVWMAENLRYLPVVHNNSEFANAATNGQPGYGVFDYNGNNTSQAKAHANYKSYGVIYNWYAINTTNVCPAGWHVASRDEWETLIEYLGGVPYAGGKLKETGFDHWPSPNGGATNETGFAARPGGYRALDGTFRDINGGFWWSSSEHIGVLAWFFGMDNLSAYVGKNYWAKGHGFYVRCVKD